MSQIPHNQIKTQFDICIVNYNTKELTRACLKHIISITENDHCDIWVVDNGSTDGSVEMLESIPKIKLIKRRPEQAEEGHTAHATAIDLVFNKTNKPYLVLMHTDTIIYSPLALDMLFTEMAGHKKIGAVGCLDQVYEGSVGSVLKKLKKGLSRKRKMLAFVLGLRDKPPSKSVPNPHIRSFFSVWNIGAMKEEGLCFNMGNTNPGYMAQNILADRGYSFIALPTKLFFKHIDHLEAATVAQKNPYHFKHRKSKRFQNKLKKLIRPE